MRIDIEGLSWGVPGRRIIHDVTARLEPGDMVGLVGPNGSGKSSLLRCVVGLRVPQSGRVLLDGVDVATLPRRDLAHRVAFVEQTGASPDEMTVADVVALGRLPHRGRWRGPSRRDDEIVAAAMQRLEILPLAARRWTQISGGEQQRAQIARALAQEPRCLVLDEPTNHLDIRHQLDLLQRLRDSGLTVVVSLHDLTLAARYCDRVLVLQDGRLIVDGEPGQALTPQVIRSAFDVDAVVGVGPRGDQSLALYPQAADA